MVQEYDRFGMPVLHPKDVKQMKLEIKKQIEPKIISHKRTFLQIVRSAFTPLRDSDFCNYKD